MKKPCFVSLAAGLVLSHCIGSYDRLLPVQNDIHLIMRILAGSQQKRIKHGAFPAAIGSGQYDQWSQVIKPPPADSTKILNCQTGYHGDSNVARKL